MAIQIKETVRRAQLVQMLERLPEIEVASGEEAAASQPDAPAEEQSNNRWGFTFRSKVKHDPQTSGKMGLQGV